MQGTLVKDAVVIGGAGFLGAALASEFRRRGASVRVFDLVAHPDPSIPTQLGDLRDKAQVRTACEEAEVVFQTAALVDWGPRSKDRLVAVNFEGNHNVVSTCVVASTCVDFYFSHAKAARDLGYEPIVSFEQA